MHVFDTTSNAGTVSADGTTIRAKLRGGRPKGSKDKKPRRPRTSGNATSPIQIGQVAALGAEGLKTPAIARALNLPEQTVRNTLTMPETQMEIAKRRHLLKGLTMRGIESVAGKAWRLTDEMVEAKDPEGFDKMTRGLASMERIAASVTGESRQVEHSGSIETTPQSPLLELKALIMLVKGESSDR